MHSTPTSTLHYTPTLIYILFYTLTTIHTHIRTDGRTPHLKFKLMHTYTTHSTQAYICLHLHIHLYALTSTFCALTFIFTHMHSPHLPTLTLTPILTSTYTYSHIHSHTLLHSHAHPLSNLLTHFYTYGQIICLYMFMLSPYTQHLNTHIHAFIQCYCIHIHSFIIHSTLLIIHTCTCIHLPSLHTYVHTHSNNSLNAIKYTQKTTPS